MVLMKTFAQINAAGICVAVLQTAGEVDSKSLIELPEGEGFALVRLGQKWNGGKWERLKQTTQEAEAIELARIDQQTGMNRTMREAMIAMAEKVGADVSFLKTKEAQAVELRGMLRG